MKKKIKDDAYNSRIQEIGRILNKIKLGNQDSKLLDVGCNFGNATLFFSNILSITNKNLFGIDYSDDCLREAQKKFNAIKVDLETDKLPFESNHFDYIICDQVLEHIKNIENVIKEVDRVLKKGGYFIASTPNLAAYHNRLLLLFGRQPACMNIFSDHIRGFVPSALKGYVTANTSLKEFKKSAAGFYPLFGVPAKYISKILPNFSVYEILVFKK